MHGEYAGTEVKLPWGAPEVGTMKMLAFGVDDAGTPTSVFPTANAGAGPWTVNYAWADLCNTTPSAGIPRARLATLALNSPESALAPWGHDMDLHYVVTVNNPEADPLIGAQVQLLTTPGLGYQSLAGSGGTCGSCPVGGTTWTLNVPPVPARGSAEFTVTGRLASVLTGIDAVTTTAHLSLPITPSGASVLEQVFSHRVDSRVPAAGVMVPGGTIGLAGLEVFGDANDGDGIGVDFVEVRVNGGPWQLVNGHGVVVQERGAASRRNQSDPGGASDGLLRPDQHGGASQPLVVDGVAPGPPSFVVPPVLIGDFVELGGTAMDPFPAGGELLRVEVQVDDPNGPWVPAILNTATGTVTWLFTWDVPPENGFVHQLRARAVDAAGNVGPATAWQQTTTFPRLPVDAGPDQRRAVGTVVQFAGSFTPWGTPGPYDILWNFGDGTTVAATVTSPADPALSPTHVYSLGGVYQVTLSVTHDGAVPVMVATSAASAAPSQVGVTLSDTMLMTIVGSGDPTARGCCRSRAEAVNGRVAVAWETGPEADVAGFNVYRAIEADGPWPRVNEALIPARGGAGAGRPLPPDGYARCGHVRVSA